MVATLAQHMTTGLTVYVTAGNGWGARAYHSRKHEWSKAGYITVPKDGADRLYYACKACYGDYAQSGKERTP